MELSQLTKPRVSGAGPACADTGPTITAVPGIVYVGDNFPIIGSGFTPGSVINFFVATSSGVINYGPLIPTNILPNSLTVFLPITVSQGVGVAGVQIVNTDESHVSSNTSLALLQGDATLGFPSLTAINEVGLSPTSTETGVALANVEAVVAAGSTVTLSGTGFDTANGVGVDLFCDCPASKVGPFFLLPGNPGLSADSLTFAFTVGRVGSGDRSGILSDHQSGQQFQKRGGFSADRRANLPRLGQPERRDRHGQRLGILGADRNQPVQPPERHGG